MEVLKGLFSGLETIGEFLEIFEISAGEAICFECGFFPVCGGAFALGEEFGGAGLVFPEDGRVLLHEDDEFVGGDFLTVGTGEGEFGDFGEACGRNVGNGGGIFRGFDLRDLVEVFPFVADYDFFGGGGTGEAGGELETLSHEVPSSRRDAVALVGPAFGDVAEAFFVDFVPEALIPDKAVEFGSAE